MHYPIEILPDTNRKLISCDISEHYLIRSTASKEVSDLWDSETEEILQNAICHPTDNITDLSSSLLGIFILKHNLISLTKEGKDKYGIYCNPDQKVIPPLFDVDFYINENKGCWFVLIGKINYLKIQYYFGDLPNKTFEAICTVIHSPALWNYWHFSIRWFLPDRDCYLEDIVDVKLKRKITKRLSTEARALIAKYAFIIEPQYLPLSPECYEK